MAVKTDLTVGVCIVSNRKVLLVQHAKLKKWLLPGGHVEPGEMPSDAAAREAREETGLEIAFVDYGPVKSAQGTIEKKPVPFEANLHSVGDHNHYNMSYMAIVAGGTLAISEESTDMGWFDKAQIERMEGIPDNVRNIVLYALEREER